ncbi:homocysteine S-methyltransferase family protein [Sporichthya sp.]|uniref:homocysteine S-methyltransferase family protein n=1 Tax=Sporichthya sp. TaxID=65475 RepID=UPI0017C25ECA|nr:homocysteine S-methyltransferase family protein [Sporichthya sp.]MBA3743789.1 homocysteine S-methyltransferase family protein [Sporichthya sp.]
MLQWVTDGGLETDLLFHHGVDLPEFAAFPLVEDADGAKLLERYYAGYAAIAAAAGAGLVLETPTWRANPDWAAKLGYDAPALDRANRAAVAFVRGIADAAQISGVIGPRGDGYIAAGTQADEAAEYHAAQIGSFAAAGVDVVHAMTLTGPAEAIGVVRAARDAGLPVGISFTVETDGRLPDGTALGQAIAMVDAAAAPDWYGVNCAHPTHVPPALDGGAWQDRIRVFRPNASTMTHEELDAMEVLDEGDRPLLQSSTAALLAALPSVTTLGGCCGTDASHVALLWGVHPAS